MWDIHTSCFQHYVKSIFLSDDGYSKIQNTKKEKFENSLFVYSIIYPGITWQDFTDIQHFTTHKHEQTHAMQYFNFACFSTIN